MRQFIVDAFTDKVFSGNPAAVCILEKWLPEDLMMNITRENNLSETAFAVKENDHYHLRWFTPGGEIDLCGHATLGTAYVILNYYEENAQEVRFNTLSGLLIVKRNNDLYELDFPAYSLKKVEITEAMAEAYGAKPIDAYMGRDLFCVFENEDIVRNLSPDQEKLKKLDGLLQHATAKGKDYDCVSRSFAPKCSICEDPVCGSGHCHIVPYWVQKENNSKIIAYQASKRGGVLYCELCGDRVKLSGKLVIFSISELMI